MKKIEIKKEEKRKKKREFKAKHKNSNSRILTHAPIAPTFVRIYSVPSFWSLSSHPQPERNKKREKYKQYIKSLNLYIP